MADQRYTRVKFVNEIYENEIKDYVDEIKTGRRRGMYGLDNDNRISPSDLYDDFFVYCKRKEMRVIPGLVKFGREVKKYFEYKKLYGGRKYILPERDNDEYDRNEQVRKMNIIDRTNITNYFSKIYEHYNGEYTFGLDKIHCLNQILMKKPYDHEVSNEIRNKINLNAARSMFPVEVNEIIMSPAYEPIFGGEIISCPASERDGDGVMMW